MRPEGYYRVIVSGQNRSAEFEIRLAGGRITGETEAGARLVGSYFIDPLSSRVRFSVHAAAASGNSSAIAHDPLALKGEFDPARSAAFSYRDGDRSYDVTVQFSAPLCHEMVAA